MNYLIRVLVLGLVIARIAPANADDLSTRIVAAVPDGFSGQIVVASPERRLYSGSFGLADRETERPVVDSTLFDIGSITKTFTATAILQLAGAGRLELDATLDAYFAGLEPPKSGITIHQLLTHSSGLPEYSGEDEEQRTGASFDAWLVDTPLDFPPGDHYAYSNPGYSALARIVEKVSGRGYEEYLQQMVLDPLGITAIGYVQLPRNLDQAVGYFDGTSGGIPSSRSWLEDGPGWNLRGNGGLLASAESLMTFGQALVRGDTLPPEQAAAQLKEQIRQGEEGRWYGYGIGISERPYGRVISHNGGNGAFFAMLAWYPENGLLLTVTQNAFDENQLRALLPALRAAVGIGED